MNYEEFKSLDKIGAYVEFKSIRHLKDSGLIPNGYEDLLADKCTCGSDRIMNSELTIITCCNPNCFIKMGYKLDKFLKAFDCKGLGPATCIDICKKGIKDGIFVLPSFIEILNCFEDFKWFLGAKYEYLLKAVDKIHKTPLTFYQMIQYLGFYGLDTKCENVFNGIKNSKDLEDILSETSIISFFANRGVEDYKKILDFYLRFKEIKAFEILHRGKLLLPAKININLCITGAVRPNGVSMSRKEFISYCNLLGQVDDIPIFSFKAGKAFGSASYFIVDRPTSSLTYEAALERQSRNPDKKIIFTSTEFVDLIKSEVAKCQQKKTEMLEENITHT